LTPLSTTTLFLALAFGAPAFSQADLPEQLGAIVDAVEAQGLPAGALEAKANEGLAKGVPAARIAGVLEGMAADLALVADTLGPQAHGSDREAVLAASISAQSAGISAGGLRSLAVLPSGVRARAIQAAADLLRLGFSEREVLELVSRAAHADEPLANLSGLATAASLLVSGGLDPSSAAARLRSDGSSKQHPLTNVPPQGRSDLPGPAQDAPGHGPGGPK
jgi:hypothetical protein